MTRATSLFLDVLRLAAALTVFLAHTVHFWNPPLRAQMQALAHDAVILFFVLSGYVIAATTDGGARSVREYVVARSARLLSVTVPALVLTFVLWRVGRLLDPGLYGHFERGGAAARFLLSATFANELWFLNAYPPTNTPYWSLGYEFWYYAFFGIAVFVRPVRARIVALVLCGTIMGPKILLLLPVWLVGVAAYRWRDCWRIPRGAALAGFAGAGLAVAAGIAWMSDYPANAGEPPWYFSGAAATDLLLGLGWGATIWFFRLFGGANSLGEGASRSMRWCAGHTFSLYLYHVPLVIFATALVPMIDGKLGPACWIMGAILAVVLVLGAVTEAQRGKWRRLIVWLLDASDRVLRRRSDDKTPV